MSKETKLSICNSCESEYKLIYDYRVASGEPKFCPFCASEIYNNDYDYTNDEEEET